MACEELGLQLGLHGGVVGAGVVVFDIFFSFTNRADLISLANAFTPVYLFLVSASGWPRICPFRGRHAPSPRKNARSASMILFAI